MEPINEANAPRSGGKRMAPSEGGSKKPLYIGLAVLGVLVTAYAGLCFYVNSLNTFYPNLCINGIDVGGLTLAQAQTQVQAEFPERIITLESAGETLGSASVKELGYSGTDIPQQVQQCWSAEQKQGLLRRGWQYLRALLGFETSYTFLVQQDDAVFTRFAHELTEALHRPALDAGYALTPEGKLLVTVAQDGRAVEESALRAVLEEAVEQPGKERTAEIPFTTLSAETLTAQTLYNELHGEMKNATYDAAAGAIVPEQTGVDFDVQTAQTLMDGAAPGSTVELPAAVQYPKVTAAELETVLFRDVLGQARTHVTGTEARISNVKLAGSAFNGVVLNSGDVFSYNATVGQRTAARGYKPAPAYIRGETVDEIGGGVCQPSSTLYLACLLADMEIVERTNHRYVPAYIDWGMDATVSWGTLDYQFANNTDYPVKIVTTYENDYLTVRLLGTNATGKTAKMSNKIISTTPWETIYQEDPTMEPGSADVVKTTPYTGYKVEAYHTIYDADGKVIDTHLESRNTYHARNKVVLQAPKAPETSAPVEVPDPIDPDGYPDPVNEPAASETPDGDFGDMLDEGAYGIL